MKHTIIIFILLFPFSYSQAEFSYKTQNIYTWIDDNKVINYSEKPPQPRFNFKVIKSLTNNNPVKVNNMTNYDDQLKKEKSMGSDTHKRSLDEIKYCETLANNIATIEANSRVRVKRPNGEYEILEADQQLIELSRIRKLIEEFCS